MGIMQQLRERFSLIYNKESEVFNLLKQSLTTDGKLLYAGEFLQRAANLFSDSIALIGGGKKITYKELYFRSVLLSKKLQKLGIKPHDRVILYFGNSISFYVGYFAIWQVGAVCVPLNVFLHERELAHVIKDSEAKVVICSKELENRFGKVQETKLIDCFPIIVTEEDFDWQTPVPLDVAEINDDFQVCRLPGDALCLLPYTSGTTGTSKGVMLSSRNVVTNMMQILSRLTMHSSVKEQLCNERFFAALPLFHVFAQNTCIWFPMIVGGTIIVVPQIDRREILAGLKERPTFFFGVPALYGLLALLKTAPLDEVKFFVSGGDVLPDKIRAAFAMVYGRKICSGYGLSEASPVVAVNMENREQPTYMVGPPLPGIEYDIRDKKGDSLSIRQVGQLWIKGDNVMIGYYKTPEATEKVLKDGWLNTGDLAMFDEMGSLGIMGRSKELIIHKGFNIYPQEVENILLLHPAVYQAAVIGKDDAFSGQVPVAFVALKEMSKNIEQKLRDFCSNHLATYKIPRKFICVDDLPLNQTGKIDKKQLNIDQNER